MEITLDDNCINDFVLEGMKRTIVRAKQAHFTNVRIRINGKWEEYEADWIKHLKVEPKSQYDDAATASPQAPQSKPEQ